MSSIMNTVLLSKEHESQYIYDNVFLEVTLTLEGKAKYTNILEIRFLSL